MKTRRQWVFGLPALVVGGLAVSALPANADPSFPNRPIRLVVGAAPGDNTDIAARILADNLRGSLGQPVVVENRPGAAGLLAGSLVRNARPDGYTLLLGNLSSLVIGPQAVSPLPYDSTRAFTPIIITQQGPTILVVNSAVPARTLQELIELSKSRRVIFALSSVGSAQHLVMEIVQQRTGAQFDFIPYRGTSSALQAAVAGEADVTITATLLADAQVKSGAIRALATYGERRAGLFPDLPTFAEALAIPEIGHDFWFGVVGPTGLDAAIVARLSSAISAAMQTPATQEILARNAQVFVPNSPTEFANSLAAQWSLFGAVARENNIRLQ